jgi:tRNA modification GTPase
MLKRLGLPAFPILEISALTGQGMDELVQALIPAGEKADALEDREDVFMTSLRHKECIERAATAVTNAGNALRQGLTLDCAAADVRDALEALGGITGESVGEELQQEIFQRFCIGK